MHSKETRTYSVTSTFQQRVVFSEMEVLSIIEQAKLQTPNLLAVLPDGTLDVDETVARLIRTALRGVFRDVAADIFKPQAKQANISVAVWPRNPQADLVSLPIESLESILDHTTTPSTDAD